MNTFIDLGYLGLGPLACKENQTLAPRIVKTANIIDSTRPPAKPIAYFLAVILLVPAPVFLLAWRETHRAEMSLLFGYLRSVPSEFVNKSITLLDSV